MELMSAIIEPNNMHLAYRRVTRNKGSAGVDGMHVEQLKAYLQQHWPTLKQQLVVNFNSSSTPAGADQLDFSSYFVNTKTTAGDTETITLVDHTGFSSATVVNDDEVTIISFTDLDNNTTPNGIDPAVTNLSNVTGNQLGVELAAAGVTGAGSAISEHVFLIHNDPAVNAGEYLVVTANTTASNGDLANVTIVGTLDFGAALTYASLDVADFA